MPRWSGPRGSSAAVVVWESQKWGFDTWFYEGTVALDRLFPPKWCTLWSPLYWLLPRPSQPGTSAGSLSHPAVLSISGHPRYFLLSPLTDSRGAKAGGKWLVVVVGSWEALDKAFGKVCIFLSCIPQQKKKNSCNRRAHRVRHAPGLWILKTHNYSEKSSIQVISPPFRGPHQSQTVLRDEPKASARHAKEQLDCHNFSWHWEFL